MKKLLITGSEGFVGQHLVNQLRGKYNIVGLSHAESLESEENIEYVIGDILNKNRIYELLNQYKPEAIVHLAAIAQTWKIDSTTVFNVNFFGTLNLYESILKVKQEDSSFNPKILYISSADVYGKTKNAENISEDSPFYPVNHYAVSKVAADRLSYQFSLNNNLNIVVVRPFNHTGPGQRKGFFVPDMVSQIVELEKDPEKHELMVGNLESIKDFLDVRDVVSAYEAILEKDIEPGTAINVCSGNGIKFKDILELILKNSGKGITLKDDPERMRPSEVPLLIGNNQKLKDLTGWEPKFSLEQTLKDTMEFWRNSANQG
jgi:GDP-4-dehydro-6-deoxy-D-mannose reductase